MFIWFGYLWKFFQFSFFWDIEQGQNHKRGEFRYNLLVLERNWMRRILPHCNCCQCKWSVLFDAICLSFMVTSCSYIIASGKCQVVYSTQRIWANNKKKAFYSHFSGVTYSKESDPKIISQKYENMFNFNLPKKFRKHCYNIKFFISV